MRATITGAKELERALGELPKKIARTVVRKAVRKGAKIMAAEAKSNARRNVGGSMGKLIARRIGVSAATRQRPGSYTMYMDVKADEEFVHVSKDGNRSWIPNAIEYGHIARGGGFVPPNPYLRPAFDSKKGEAISIMTREIRDGVVREADRMRKG